jgi:membrane protease YdiL (CAAX protease family)
MAFHVSSTPSLVPGPVDVTLNVCFEWTLSAVIETAKNVAAVIFLDLIRRSVLSVPSSFSKHAIYGAVIISPVLEEVLFRGVLLSALQGMQKVWNLVVVQRLLTPQEERMQQIFRIHLSAFLFGIGHYFFNPSRSLDITILNCVVSYGDGVSYGYLREKYRSLAVGVLIHGLHNAICIAMAGHHAIRFGPLLLGLLIALKVGAYLLATTQINGTIANKASDIT